MLPLSIYGALAMSHGPDGGEGTAAADEFFIYKFDRCAVAVNSQHLRFQLLAMSHGPDGGEGFTLL